MTISRRKLLAASAALPLAVSLAQAASNVSITVDPRRSLGRVSPDYMGLGYEISSVALPGLLSATNQAYVRLVRNLGSHGVIRIGGNTSDFASYAPRGPAVSAPKATVVDDANLKDLRGFLDATGWKLIWGLNLGDERQENLIAEARAVADLMGDRLLALEIGNEPDLFTRSGHRQGLYDYAAWLAQYRRYKAAIRAVLPRAPFAGPDLAGASDWMTQFARDEGQDIALLTAHHYITGQASPSATLDTMLGEEKKYQAALSQFQAASETANRPWRMCETASYSGGGKQGVSDTFAAALWALDYLLVLAGHGCAGVNMETGVNHLGWISHYTPISDDLHGHYGAAPEYYGLLAFAQLARGEMLGVACQATGLDLTAYALRPEAGELCLFLVNKDRTQDAAAELAGLDGMVHGRTMRLTGPSLEAQDGVLLGGAMVLENGTWSGAKSVPVAVANGRARIHVSAGSAALLWFTA